MKQLWFAPLMLMLAACSDKPAEPASTVKAVGATGALLQCGKDTDCKGDRICEQGQCVAPAANALASNSASPTQAPLPPIQVVAENTVALPVCVAGDTREKIPVWTPEGDEKANWTPKPPQKDGQIVFIDTSMSAEEAKCDEQSLNTFDFPDDPNDVMAGGLAVNVRGNALMSNGICHFRGFYMNEDVPGVHQGWVETFFGAVPKKDVIMSGRYCLERAAP